MAGYTDDIKAMIARQAKMPSASDTVKNLNTQVNGAVPTVNNTVTAPTAYNPTEDINRLKEMQKAQAISGLAKARDSALSNLGAEKAEIKPMYYNKRNETATGSQMQARNFAEYMANRGQTNSGTSAQAELSRNVSLQGNIGALNQQENKAYEDIARRQTAIKNAYASDLASANAGIEASALNQLIAANQQAYANALNQYNTDRSFNFNSDQANLSNARADKSLNWSMDTVNNPALAGQILQNTAQGIQNQYLPQQIEGQIIGQNLSNEAQIIQNQYAPQIAQGQIDGQTLQNAYQTLINQGYPAQQAAQLASIYANIRQGDAQVKISQQNANTSAGQLAWAKDPKNPDNIAKVNAASNKGSSNMLNDVTTAIYNKIYTGNNNDKSAMNMLQGNKGAILEDLTTAGMSGSDALKFYKQMEDDLYNRLLED